MLPAMNARKLHTLKNEMQAFVEDVAAGIGRSERKQWCSTYLRGLLLDGDRKSIEPMAGRLTAIDQPKKGYVQALQQFINQSNWEDSLVQENMRRRIGRSRSKRVCSASVPNCTFRRHGRRMPNG
jgi:SRSO17 transposase